MGVDLSRIVPTARTWRPPHLTGTPPTSPAVHAGLGKNEVFVGTSRSGTSHTAEWLYAPQKKRYTDLTGTHGNTILNTKAWLAQVGSGTRAGLRHGAPFTTHAAPTHRDILQVRAPAEPPIRHLPRSEPELNCRPNLQFYKLDRKLKRNRTGWESATSIELVKQSVISSLMQCHSLDPVKMGPG